MATLCCASPPAIPADASELAEDVLIAGIHSIQACAVNNGPSPQEKAEALLMGSLADKVGATLSGNERLNHGGLAVQIHEHSSALLRAQDVKFRTVEAIGKQYVCAYLRKES